MNNFELAKNYGATVYLVFSFLKQTPTATIDEVANETGISRKTASYTLNTLFDIKLVNRDFTETARKLVYSTVIQ